MKRMMIIFAVSVILNSALALTSYAYSYTDYSVYTDNSKVVVNSDGLYLISWSGKQMSVIRSAPDNIEAELSLNYSPAVASVFGSTLVALCNDLDHNQLIVYTFDIVRDSLDSFAINDAYVRYDRGFCYDGGSLYLTDERRNNVINQYSSGGLLVDSCTFTYSVSAIVSGYSGGAYVVSGNKLFRNSGGGYYAMGGGAVSSPAAFCFDDTLIDAQGRVYSVNSGGMSLLFNADFSGNQPSACVIGSYIYCSNGNQITRYDMSGNKSAYLNVVGAVKAMYSRNGRIYALSGDSRINEIGEKEFILINNNDQSANNDSRSNNNKISSEVYRVDSTNYRISLINSPTTFAQFKKNMRFDGYKAKLFRGAKELTGGNVGTAMTAVFSSDNSYTYELAVRGDITGEGNINSRDVKELMSYLLGDISFDGVYYIAADVSDDDEVDILDLAILSRMNK